MLSINDFLTEEYLGHISKDLYKETKETLLKYFDPNKNYQRLFLSSDLGSGKTFTAMLAILYMVTRLCLEKDTFKTLKLSPESRAFIGLSTFGTPQTKKWAMLPLINLVKQLPIFSDVEKEGKVFYRSDRDLITFNNAIQVGSFISLDDLVGANLIMAVYPDVQLLNKKVSAEEIIQQMVEVSIRIKARFEFLPNGGVIIENSKKELLLRKSNYDVYIK